MRKVLFLFLLFAWLPLAAPASGVLDMPAGRFDAPALEGLAAPEADDGIRIAHFAGPIGAAERESLREAGFEILGYMPDNALLIRGDSAERATGLPGLDFMHPYRPEWRRDPGLTGRGGEVLELCLDLWPGEDAGRAADRAVALGAQITHVVDRAGHGRVFLRTTSLRVEDLSRLPGLRWMSEVGIREDRLRYAKLITQSALAYPDSTPVWAAGLHGEGQIVGHLDSDFQVDNCFFYDMDGYPVGPDHRKVVYIDPDHVEFYHGHGIHTSSIMVGDIGPVYGWDTHRGMAYLARIASSHYDSYGGDLYVGLSIHHDYGARLHSNSWGNDGTTTYTQDCHDIDQFSHEFEYDLVAFAVTNTSALKTPENAKSVLAVGATLNLTDTQTDPFRMEQHGSGGMGPTFDGRRKPEVYAPGASVRAADKATTDDPGEWQSFCRGVPRSGTSMACPVVVGCGALIRQYFMEGWYPGGAPSAEDGFAPTGALLRAALLNSTHDLAGVPGYPSDLEGWGRLQMNLGLKLEQDSPLSLYLEDFHHGEGLETGQERIYHFVVTGDSIDLKVTMAFSDYPAEVMSTHPVVNDLDLELVSPLGTSYLGNQFSDGYSSPGGDADSLNCVERVIVASPEPGIWILHIRGTNVPMGPQGYAFIVSGQLSDADTIFPELSLDYAITGSTLRILLIASEPLDPETVAMEMHQGDWEAILPVEALDGVGLVWAGEFELSQGTGNFQVQTCGSDPAGNPSCADDQISLFLVGAGQSAYLESQDGRLHLDLPPGSLPDTGGMLIHKLPDEYPQLAAYRVLPAMSLDAPALLEWGYSEVEFPAWGDPQNLKLRNGEGEALESYFDEDEDLLLARVESLGLFYYGWGFDGSSGARDGNFLHLSEAFPNPYRPADHGELGFLLELRDAHKLRAEIFDVSGRRVATLADGWILPGTRRLAWNGSDDEGQELASGVYFLRMEAAGEVVLRKMVMMR